MHGYIDPFYEAAASEVAPGHVWEDQPVYLPATRGLKVTRVNPRDDRDLAFETCGRTAEIFQHPPIHSLGLESSEGFVLSATKINRPVIVLGGLAASGFTPRQSPSHHEIAWAIPVYGSDQYEEAVRRRIRVYDFQNCFFLPEDRALGFDEGFARLDHAQPVWQSHLARHRGFRLSGDALDALREWFVHFSTGQLDPDSLIMEYRREQTEA